MAIDRRLLIFGNAVLFSALGCDDGGGTDPLPDAERQGRDGRVEADLDPEADMSAAPDMFIEADMTRADDMSLEPDATAVPDMAPAFDMGGPADMYAEPDMAELDQSVEPDLDPPDMAWLPDMAAEPDMALVPDMAPPEPDMAPPLGCAELIGEACVTLDEGCCPDGQTPEAVCWGDANGRTSWQAIPADFFCNCALGPDQTTYQVFCAVPGFVGIERAGRRLRGPRLRALLAA